jgi:hypothetical protein
LDVEGAIWDMDTSDYLQMGSVTFTPGTLLAGNVIQHEYVAATNLDYLLVDLTGSLQPFFPPEALVILGPDSHKVDIYGVGQVPEPSAWMAWCSLAPLGVVSLLVGRWRRSRGAEPTAAQ